MTLLESQPSTTQIHQEHAFTMPQHREAYLCIAQLALEHGWEQRISRVGQGALLLDTPMYLGSTSSRARGPWYQVHRYDIPSESPVTVELQPIFGTQLSRHVDTFVHVYDRNRECVQPTLNILSPNPHDYGRLLTQFALPEGYLLG